MITRRDPKAEQQVRGVSTPMRSRIICDTVTSDRMAGIDAFYTPAKLARRLIEFLPDTFSGTLLDPAAGAGSLLRAASDRFGDRVELVGIDINRRAIEELRRAEPSWSLSVGDTLSEPSRRATRAWRRARLSVGAVVMNPPFSTRGQAGRVFELDGFTFKVAPSLEFLLTTIRELHPTHGFLAILPEGALTSDRYGALWSALRRSFDVRVCKVDDSSYFPGARVSVVLVHMERRVSNPFPRERDAIAEWALHEPSMTDCRCVEIIRGRVPVFRVPNLKFESNAVPFLHTTSLRAPLSNESRYAPKSLADVAPFLLLSRVGRWSAPVEVDGGEYVLSDCLYALRTPDGSALPILARALEENADSFASAYRGTGAKHITLGALCSRLVEIGWSPTVRKAGSPTSASCDGSCGSISAGRKSTNLVQGTLTSRRALII
ncbi:N-6 DNA methylase [Curtobacterium sp. BRB10]|uniref:N-6 DNA methylase n=1 Tax=Curtobacterium sp. BRB10 TaxID=2962579 RepID=UPI0037C1B1F7